MAPGRAVKVLLATCPRALLRSTLTKAGIEYEALDNGLLRLRLHGLIERTPHSHRYRLTQRGIQIAAFWTRTYNRLLRPGLAQLADPACESPPLRGHERETGAGESPGA
jgi:DNA-binding IclR family transcriptional regulator